MEIEVEHICQHCNATFNLSTDTILPENEKHYTFQNCPECGKRNDVWIKVKLLGANKDE